MSFDDLEFNEQGTEIFKKRTINNLEPTDNAVTLTGYARKVNKSNEFNLDDTTGQIHIRDLPDEVDQIQEGQLYRVLGNVSLDGSGTKYVSTVLIRSAEGLNFDLYLKTISLLKKIP